jgi:hypothetical protein
MGRLERPKQRLAKAYYSAAPIAQRTKRRARCEGEEPGAPRRRRSRPKI